MKELLDTAWFFRTALAGSVLVAVCCAVVGVHVVGRRIVLTGLALPQVAAAGIALSFLAEGFAGTGEGTGLAWLRNHDLMALLACMAGAAALMERPGRRGGAGEVRTAAVFCLAGGLSFLLVQGSAAGMEEVRNLVAGDVLGIHEERLAELALFLVPVLLLTALLHRRFLFAAFDPGMAASLGIRTRLHDLLFYACLAVTVARSVHATGTLSSFAFLVLPGAAAMRLWRGEGAVFAGAAALAAAGAASGFLVAADDRVNGPVGPTATAVMFLLFAAACGVRWVLDSRRGPAATSAPR